MVAVGGKKDFFVWRNPDQRVTIQGRSAAGLDDSSPKLSIDSVTPGCFRAVGIELLEGRDFDERDLEPGAAGVIIMKVWRASSGPARARWANVWRARCRPHPVRIRVIHARNGPDDSGVERSQPSDSSGPTED